MRIAIVTQEEPFYLPPALAALCAARRRDVVAVIVLPSFNESLGSTARRLLAFYGPFDFARLTLRYARARLADAWEARFGPPGPKSRPFSAAAVARRLDLPLHQPENINAAAFVATLEHDVRPDLIVSLAASQIFRKRVLRVAPLGCINLHSAPLPRYQGMMPNFWTLLHGEPEAAVTVHYMVERLDAGDILVQRPVPILPHDSLHDVMVRSKTIGVEALLEAIDQIEADSVKPRPMATADASYFTFPTAADAKRLREMGRALL